MIYELAHVALGVMRAASDPVTVPSLVKSASSGTNISTIALVVGVVSGAGALVGAIFTFFRGKRTDRYGIYSQAFKDLTTDIERVRLEAEQDREQAKRKHQELADENLRLQDQIAQMENRIATLVDELTTLRKQKPSDELLKKIADLEAEIAKYKRELSILKRRLAREKKGELDG